MISIATRLIRVDCFGIKGLDFIHVMMYDVRMINLPSDFDLHFDIKTKKQLIQEYRWLKDKIKLMEKLCKHYKIDLPTE
jgi:hypothetical protein